MPVVGSPTLEERLLWLCQQPSLTGEEHALCSALEERLRGVSGGADLRRYGDSLVLPLKRGSTGPHVALVGHLDVVRTEHDAAVRIEGDRLYGPGSSDMKSGLSLMWALSERKALPDLNLTLVFYAREEGPFADNELGRVLAEDPELKTVDVALALEPSDNKLQLGCGGSLHGRVTFRGKTAHSARPWQGVNAIQDSAELLMRLRELEPDTRHVDGLEWREVISVTMANGGRSRNIVPDRFELNINFRFAPGRELNDAEAHFRAVVGEGPEIEFVDRSPAAPPHRSHPLIAALADSGVAAVEPKQAWTDVARFAQLGIPAANFGPGVQAQAHQRNEWTSIPQLYQGQAILLRWLESLERLAVLLVPPGSS